MNKEMPFFCRIRVLFALVVALSLPSFAQDHHSWSKNLNIYEVNTRQYTASGTFAEFATHLDRLEDLGVGIVWFMPIHPIGQQNRLGSLGSPYSVRDYMDVNPEFGTLNEFKALVDSIHARGMYVILDWVANHTAWDNPLTVTHPEWYVQDGGGNFTPPPGTNWSDVIQLDYDQQGLRDYMVQAMTFWITEANVDGFRCDAVSFMPWDFWFTAIPQLKSVKPELFMLAEDDRPIYQTLGFDACYSWGMHAWGDGVLDRIYERTNNAHNLHHYMEDELRTFLPNHYRMYFTSNHDENAWYGTVFEQFPNAAEIYAVVTATIGGMQLIYGGQEAGLDHRLAFFDKDQIIWRSHPFAEVYRTLLHLKRRNRALWNGTDGGTYQRVTTSNDDQFMAFVREKEEDRVFAVFNLSPGISGATLTDSLHWGTYRDVFSGDTLSFSGNSDLLLNGWEYRLYEKISLVSGIGDGPTVASFNLSQNYPNPFNPETQIRYRLSESGSVSLIVYNSLGQTVRVLAEGHQGPGDYRVRWDGRDGAGRVVSSGVYYYRLAVESPDRKSNAGSTFFQTRKMLLLR